MAFLLISASQVAEIFTDMSSCKQPKFLQQIFKKQKHIKLGYLKNIPETY
jgi:hypothetical protein